MSPSKNSQNLFGPTTRPFPLICCPGVVSSHGLTGTILSEANEKTNMTNKNDKIENYRNFRFLLMTLQSSVFTIPGGPGREGPYGEAGPKYTTIWLETAFSAI